MSFSIIHFDIIHHLKLVYIYV